MKNKTIRLTVAILLAFFAGFLGKASAQDHSKSIHTNVSIHDGDCSRGEASKAIVFLKVYMVGVFQEKYIPVSVRIEKDGKTVEEKERTLLDHYDVLPYLLEPGEYTAITSYKDSFHCSTTFTVRGYIIEDLDESGCFSALFDALEADIVEMEKAQLHVCVSIPGGLSIQPNKEMEVDIYTFSGQKVASCRGGEEKHVVYLPTGMYIVRYNNTSKKIIVSN